MGKCDWMSAGAAHAPRPSMLRSVLRQAATTGEEGVGGVDARTEELMARFREIEVLMSARWGSPEFRRWQAATSDGLRKALGFHPTVIEFAGLRFRAGPVHESGLDEVAGISVEAHTIRMRQDLADARKLLRRALTELGVEAEVLSASPVADVDPVAAAAAGDPALDDGRRAAAVHAARRLAEACTAPAVAWAPAAEALRELLTFGPVVGKAAVRAMATRLPLLR